MTILLYIYGFWLLLVVCHRLVVVNAVTRGKEDGNGNREVCACDRK